MKSLRIWNGYIYLFFAFMFVGIVSPWLWLLSGTSPLSIGDPTGRLIALAGYFGGVEFLASLGGLLMSLSIASWFAIVSMVLIFIYRFFRGHRAGDAIDDFLLFSPSMPDGLAVAELSKYGVRIEEKEGVFSWYIQRRYWRLAWPEALAHSVTYLLYLHAQKHLEELLNSERTLFHDLAELLNKNYDEKAILAFKTQMGDDDTVCGILLDVALRQIELREEIEELQKKLAKEDELQHSAVTTAQLDLIKKTKRIDRIAPIKPAKSVEEPNEDVSGQEALPDFRSRNRTFDDYSDGDEPEKASDITLGHLKPEVARVLTFDSTSKSEAPKNAFGSLRRVISNYPKGVGALPADQVGVEGVSQQVIDDFHTASIGAEGKPQNRENGDSVISEADDFERPDEERDIGNTVSGSADNPADETMPG